MPAKGHAHLMQQSCGSCTCIFTGTHLVVHDLVTFGHAGNGWGYFILVVFLNQMAADAMISAVTAFFSNRQVQDFGESQLPMCLHSSAKLTAAQVAANEHQVTIERSGRAQGRYQVGQCCQLG